ncbi:c-type cytochrome [Singulisphaera acidiphila]|uniref:Putative heme-binding domain-containing protein n=1 Tax=Singulisphaera acidiphila (strain ATCC BAA-1392 / DSM 18658 / VKM B-2454 / MOB10) TaxID=886293 RepID=L0DP27_SINAD|nr:c-type cytochrome [Singulisphaera acidiphila]AGA31012.1 putative heme-binding domain-containing protein [Singulisphaera acidiphila DSM 18658]
MPFFQQRRSRGGPALVFMMVVGFAVQAVPSLAADDSDRVFTQKPEVAPSQLRGQAKEPAKLNPEPGKLAQGPAPTWIWGAKLDTRYFLRKEFSGDAKAAWLKATCDNRMALFLNGKRLAQSQEWEAPVELDVRDLLRPGLNELVAQVDNEGGSAGFALKLVMTMPDGSTRYVVSDASWTAADRRSAKTGAAVQTFGTMGVAPWNDVFSKPTGLASTTRDVFELLPGFQVERIFTVPRETLGSWVSITVDNKGRLIASDQGDKGLCRITPAPLGSDQPTKVERLDVKITGAHGLLYAFDSLYLSVNGGPGSGLYRARDTDGDDQFDEVVKLADLPGAGEHGPHGLRLSHDGKSILVVCGNHTKLPAIVHEGGVPHDWSEDHLLPRQWDANGHARGILAPGGYIAKTDPDGKSFEIISSGYRNAYDFDLNNEGELFAYDSDMEWDIGMPWYRPTRVVHATDGSEFGWRSGTGKWPTSYLDSLPPMLNIGPGSPVGVTFGYGTKFPAKYQKALYILDWTFGTIRALHLEPDGASYQAKSEEFVSRTPLPLTDATIGSDGAFYFTIGGRGTHSELFRVTYVGNEPTDRADATDPRFAELRALRRSLEQYHHRAADPAKAVAFALPYLGHADRFIRFAARIALEHQDVALWEKQVLAEPSPEALMTGLVGLARTGNKSLQPDMIKALNRLDFTALDEAKQLDLLRTWSLVFLRMGAPDPELASRLAKQFDRDFPAKSERLNRALADMLVYLKSPTIAAKLIALMKQERGAETTESADLLSRNPGYGGTIARMQANRPDAQKIHYAFALRNLREGWTLDERKFYFQWLETARKWSGGASYLGFINNIDKDAFENASEAERLAVEAAGARKPFQIKDLPKPKGPGQHWDLQAVLSLSPERLSGRNFAQGQKMFSAARCVVCHRFGGEGGATGPDLTQAAGRFSLKDLTEAIVEPSKVVSDQYRATVIATSSGKVHTGRVVNESDKAITLVVDPEDPTKVVEIPKTDVDEQAPSKVSLMPDKLLDPLNQNEVLDLLAYLLSRGEANDPMFRK